MRHNLFDTKFINRDHAAAKDGLNMIRMMKLNNGKPVGKIYCLTNWDDGPLQWSTNLNYVNRAGQAGIGTYDKWWGGWGNNTNLLHHEIRGYTQNYDCLPNLRSKHDKDDHGYMWYQFAIDYYKNTCRI